MVRSELETLVALGLTQRELAVRLGCSQTTVRYWLRRWGLSTVPAARAREARTLRDAGVTEVERDCGRHGRVRFVLDAEGIYRCARCRADRVAARRRRVKELLLREAGGRCVVCGYDRHPAALQFHHLDPGNKAFAIGSKGLTRGIERLRQEAAKCAVVCANCHALVEIGFLSLPPDVVGSHG